MLTDGVSSDCEYHSSHKFMSEGEDARQWSACGQRVKIMSHAERWKTHARLGKGSEIWCHPVSVRKHQRPLQTIYTV